MGKEIKQSHIAVTAGKQIKRPPVVVIMGHVDHGKSTLLDYIRKTNIVEGEAGGITQHISAYEVIHPAVEQVNNETSKNEKIVERKITFLDTPGHEAFSKMRSRGAKAADIAVLVVSAEDSVKAQTLEAWNTIIESKIPYVVAINKIDKPNADIEKTKMDLVSKGIYLEGMGGDIPFVLISAKTGQGVTDLLDIILLLSDMNEFIGNKNLPASGLIIESNRDSKRGISATCLILNGTLESGMFVVAGKALVSTRIIENFLGKNIKKASFSSPVKLIGFDEIPEVGSIFNSFKNKKEAEKYRQENSSVKKTKFNDLNNDEGCETKLIPIVVKTDVMGTTEAIENEIKKINNEKISFKIIQTGVGPINESDLKIAGVDKESIIVGFNVKIEPTANDLNESLKINIQTFDIIYKLTDWLKEILKQKCPKSEVVEIIGSIKILKKFNDVKNKQVVGGKIIKGEITDGNSVRIMRIEEELGQGKIVGIQQNKNSVKKVSEGTECGMMIDSKTEILPGDILEVFNLVIK